MADHGFSDPLGAWFLGFLIVRKVTYEKGRVRGGAIGQKSRKGGKACVLDEVDGEESWHLATRTKKLEAAVLHRQGRGGGGGRWGEGVREAKAGD